MDGLTLSADTPQRRHILAGAGGHIAAAGAMTLLMVPAFAEGHASLTGIGVTFAFFLWAAVAAACGRRRSAPAGAVGDPFAMALLMAVPYVVLGLAGHAHGAVGGASGSAGVIPLGIAVVAGWLLLRRGSARVRGAERFGFWWCLFMMVGMLLGMSLHV